MVKFNLWGVNIFLSLALSSSLFAATPCDKQLLTLSLDTETRIGEVIEQLASECGFSVILKDEEARNRFDANLSKINLKNYTLSEIFDVILGEHDLNYNYTNNLLKVSYLVTKTFHIDYMVSTRTGTGTMGVSLGGGSGTSTGATTSVSTTSATGSATSSSQGTSSNQINITTTDNYDFWKTLATDLNATITTPSDSYKAGPALINSGAGLITVTATKKQVERVESYLKMLMDRLQKQVLIDVSIMSVSLTSGNNTGVDWSQIYSVQNGQFSTGYVGTDNLGTFGALSTAGTTAAAVGTPLAATASFLKFDRTMTINNLFRFLKQFGDVKSVSNPKVLTLNNQPAIITSGDQIFYKYTGSTSTTGTATTTASNEIIDSVFAGILLDVTPEISNDDTIILKINPSISTTRENIANTSGTRVIPPDLQKKQLSSVVKARDGERIVLGGLINTSDELTNSKVPLLGDIPGFGWLFKSEAKTKTTSELVIVITPHIIKKEKPLTLKEIGFESTQKTLDEEAKEKEEVKKKSLKEVKQ